MKYPSDLSDAQWELIRELLPMNKGKKGFQPEHSNRDMMDAILYLNKTGCQWRYLPNDFPHWKAVYSYFLRLSSKGVFEKINLHLSKQYRIKVGRDENPSLFCIDSQSVDGDVNLDDKGVDGHKKVKGRKRHIVTDVLGLIFFCSVTAANVADVNPARDFVEKFDSQDRLRKVLVDRAYQGISGKYQNFTVEVTSKKPDQEGFVPLHKRWVVERSFSWLKRQKRLSRDYEFDSQNQRSMIFIGMSKLILNKLA